LSTSSSLASSRSRTVLGCHSRRWRTSQCTSTPASRSAFDPETPSDPQICTRSAPATPRLSSRTFWPSRRRLRSYTVVVVVVVPKPTLTSLLLRLSPLPLHGPPLPLRGLPLPPRLHLHLEQWHMRRPRRLVVGLQATMPLQRMNADGNRVPVLSLVNQTGLSRRRMLRRLPT